MKLISLNGSDTQPGRLVLVLLLCKACEGSMIILSRLMSIFSCVFVGFFVALYGEMTYLYSRRIPVNQAGLYPT